MGGAAGAGDNDLHPLLLGAGAIEAVALRRAVGRNDARFIANLQVFQGQRDVAHDRPIRLATHNDAHTGLAGTQDSAMLSIFRLISPNKLKSFTITKRRAAMLMGGLRNGKALVTESDRSWCGILPMITACGN